MIDVEGCEIKLTIIILMLSTDHRKCPRRITTKEKWSELERSTWVYCLWILKSAWRFLHCTVNYKFYVTLRKLWLNNELSKWSLLGNGSFVFWRKMIIHDHITHARTLKILRPLRPDIYARGYLNIVRERFERWIEQRDRWLSAKMFSLLRTREFSLKNHLGEWLKIWTTV